MTEWMDEHPYPGPDEPNDLVELFAQVTILAKVAIMPMTEAIKQMTQLMKAYRPPTTSPYLKASKKRYERPLHNHGPRAKNTFDFRGRRRN